MTATMTPPTSASIASLRPAATGSKRASAAMTQRDRHRRLPVDLRTGGCGDGVIWQGVEACDDGNTVPTDRVLKVGGRCAAMGATTRSLAEDDGFEECDDGNQEDGDGCSVTCR